MNLTIRISAFLLSILAASLASAAEYPAPTEGDFTIRDFKFASGETMPEVRIHYRTLSAGLRQKDAAGKNDQRRLDYARHDRQRRAIYPARVCR